MAPSKDVCICRNRRQNMTWIKCDYCDQWLHLFCAKITKSDIPKIVKFACENCFVTCGAATSWRCRQCPGCRCSSNCGCCSGCSSNEECEKRACQNAVVLHLRHPNQISPCISRRPLTRSRSRTAKSIYELETSGISPSPSSSSFNVSSLNSNKSYNGSIASSSSSSPKTKKSISSRIYYSSSLSSTSVSSGGSGSSFAVPLPPSAKIPIFKPERYDSTTLRHLGCTLCPTPTTTKATTISPDLKCRRFACSLKKASNSVYCSGICWRKDMCRLKGPIRLEFDSVVSIKEKCRLFGCPNHRLSHCECCSIDCMCFISSGTPRPKSNSRPPSPISPRPLPQEVANSSTSSIAIDQDSDVLMEDNENTFSTSSGTFQTPNSSIDENIAPSKLDLPVSTPTKTAGSRKSVSKTKKIPSILPSGNEIPKCFNLLCKNERIKNSKYCSKKCLEESCYKIVKAHYFLYSDPLKGPYITPKSLYDPYSQS